MKFIGILPNIDKDINLSFTKKIIEYLLKCNCKVVLQKEIANLLNMEFLGFDAISFYKKSDFIIVLGGDGTMLNASKKASIYNKPLLGVNLGTLGYLTYTEKEVVFEALDKVLNNSYTTEKRMMLECKINNSNQVKNFSALNDICLTKSIHNKMISFDLIINDELIDNYRADGIIISTPTGSTAYNLSAGGPIIKPDIDAIVITPICPQMIYARPSVISAKDTIKIKICKNENEAILSFDGENYDKSILNAEINIQKSSYFTTIIKTNNLSFYDILKSKMLKY